MNYHSNNLRWSIAHLFIIAFGSACLFAQSVVLDNFNAGTATGAVDNTTNWFNQVTQNATSITVGGSAGENNGWVASNLSLNLSGMTFVRITAQRESGNLNPSFALQLVDGDTLDTFIVSVASSAFATGSMTQVQIPIATLLGGFNMSNVSDWSIGGGGVGSTAFRMTIDNLAMANSLLPLSGGGTIITAGNQVYATPVTLNTSTILGSTGSNGNAITFNSTIDGAAGLTLNTSGVTTLNGAVGQSTALGNLVISGGATGINGGIVKTTGTQTYSTAVSIGANTLIETGPSGSVSFSQILIGNGHALEIRTAGASVFHSASGLTAFTKSGVGTLTLAGNSTYSGITTIAAGTIALGVDNALPVGGGLALAGGTLSLGGYDQTLGLLSISANSTIDFGGINAFLTFANSSTQAWVGSLLITNFDAENNLLRFGVNDAGLTLTQLASIVFVGYDNSIGQIDASGYVTPSVLSAVPEPASYGILAGMAILSVVLYRRRTSRLKRI